MPWMPEVSIAPIAGTLRYREATGADDAVP